MSSSKVLPKTPLALDEALQKVRHSVNPELWNFIFKIKKGNQVITNVWCSKCETKILYNGHADYLRKHLRNYHFDYWIQNCVNQPLTVKNENEDPPPPPNSNNSNTNGKQGLLSFPKQVVITENFRKKISEALAIWIALDDQPFAAVEGKGFRHLLRTLVQGELINTPGSAAVKAYVENLYGVVYAAVQKEVSKEATFPAISVDKWTSPAHQPYIALVLHYIASDWSHRQLLLRLAEIPPPHTAEALSKWINTVLREYNIENRPITMVTDGESALIAACAMLKYPRIYCTAHQISLVVQKLLEIPEVAIVYKRVKALVKYFRQSNVAMYELHTICETEKIPSKKLLQHSPTRWYGVFDMFLRFLELKAAISSYIEQHADQLCDSKHKTPLIFETMDWGHLKVITSHLKGLKKAVKKLESIQDASISLILPLVDSLFHKHCAQNDTDGKILRKMKETERAELQKRFCDYNYADTAVWTSPFLDPRFVTLDYTVIQQANNSYTTCRKTQTAALKMLKQKLMTRADQLDNNNVAIEEEPDPEDDFLFEFEKKKHMPFPSVEQELVSYMSALQQTHHNQQPCLTFWKLYNKTFPLLAYQARKELAIPAAAVGVERVWKGTKQIITDQRTRLLPETVQHLQYIKENFALAFPDF